MQHRYKQLQLESALTRRCDYAKACRELAHIVVMVYMEAPKVVQLLIYRDVMSAFRLLSRMDTSRQLSAARSLLQAVEGNFPKQKRALATSEYKQAALAQHRRIKHEQSETLAYTVQLPRDILVHVFGFLDSRSLAITSAVCRGWNEASRDDLLWKSQFFALFGGSIVSSRVLRCSGLSLSNERMTGSGETEGFRLEGKGCWRRAFEVARKGRPSRLFSSNRASCSRCKVPWWLSQPPSSHDKKSCMHQNYLYKPSTPVQVANFLLRSSESFTSSESESDEEFPDVRCTPRLWAYPRLKVPTLS